MRNPITKLIVAAIILVACITGIIMWTHTGSGIALADVLAQVQQATAYMYQMTMTVRGKTPYGLEVNQNMEGTILITQDCHMKMTMDMTDPNSGEAQLTEIYMLPQEKAVISLMPATKQYIRMEYDDTVIEKTRQENYDPSSTLKQILDCKYESLGRSVIEGVEVEGFRTTDPNYEARMAGQVDVKIWVDVKTQLPVREEMDMDAADIRSHIVVHNFQWNYPVDDETFKPVIPADYMALPGGTIKIPAMNEESAVAGLKLCADLAGRYPEKLDFMTITDLMDKLEDKEYPAFRQMAEEDDKDLLTLTQLAEENEGLSQEQRSKKTEELIKKIEERSKARKEQIEAWEKRAKKMEEEIKETVGKFMPIQGTVMFYMALAEEKKEPAYYGNVVTPQDADKVLMRWKVSDKEYRVIFGDLRTETVSPERLAQLEEAMLK